MSMVTRCPTCHTVFRVTPEQFRRNRARCVAGAACWCSTDGGSGPARHTAGTRQRSRTPAAGPAAAAPARSLRILAGACCRARSAGAGDHGGGFTAGCCPAARSLNSGSSRGAPFEAVVAPQPAVPRRAGSGGRNRSEEPGNGGSNHAQTAPAGCGGGQRTVAIHAGRAGRVFSIAAKSPRVIRWTRTGVAQCLRGVRLQRAAAAAAEAGHTSKRRTCRCSILRGPTASSSRRRCAITPVMTSLIRRSTWC